MSQDLLWKVAEGDAVKLNHYDPSYISKRVERDDVTTETNKLNKELGELQELLAAAQKNSVLIVLQGMDTSGKDGTIRHVMSNINPQGCEVHSFKAPTAEE